MYPNAFVEYLVHFHGDRDYFECHEVLEEYWKETTSCDKNSIWVGFILLAVSNYHYRRNNLNGANRTLSKALTILENKKQALFPLGIDANQLFSILSARQRQIHSQLPYSSFNLPIIDKRLLKKCREACLERGLVWGKASMIDKQELIHRHLFRDRSQVYREREEAIAKRKKGRE